jgi:predicted metal-dependent hydrolase
MPRDIASYVICHELAHLKEMNHSKRFRDVVAEMYPEFKKAEKWMKQYGLALQ